MDPTIKRAAPFNGMDRWSLTDEGAQWHLFVRPDEPVFAGHYPGQPILPGIYIFESLCQGVERVFAYRGTPARIAGVRSMRFLLPFLPGSHMSITAAVPSEPEDDRYVITAVVLRDAEKAASAKLVFTTDRPAHA